MNYKEIFVAVNSAALMLSTVSCGAKEEAVPKPNIIILLADDLGYNDVSCYRNENFPQQSDSFPTSQTPNLDLLARQGIRFTNFYCGAAVSSPSRAALMTGRNCTRTGVYNYLEQNSPMHLRDSEVTIAEVLKQADYATGHFGKWHLSSGRPDQPYPNDQGFDYSFYALNNSVPSHHNPTNFFRNGEPQGEIEGYSCDIVVTEALQWLDKNKQEPFFLNVWFNEPHFPMAAPEELKKRHAINPEYYGCIENMDIAIGKLMNYLKEQNLEDNTIVIFASDNGSQWDYSNLPFRGEKHFNYEGGLRVPCIVRWNKHVPTGVISEFNGCFTDILPTLASLADAPVPTDRVIDGMDISPVFLGKAETLERENPLFFFRYIHDPICMIREGDWCLLGYDELLPWAFSLDELALGKVKPWYLTKEHMEFAKKVFPKYFELYNLRDDREERIDVADKHPEIVARLKSKMLKLKQEVVAEGGDWFAEDVDER